MAEIRAKAFIKGIAQQPRKVKIVADLVRDRYVADAVIILDHTPRRAALAVKKAIESAKANLLQSGSIDAKSIRIAKISVTAGPRMRRYMPASRGRALPFEKVASHVYVEVAGDEKAKKKEAVHAPETEKTEVKTEKVVQKSEPKTTKKVEKKGDK